MNDKELLEWLIKFAQNERSHIEYETKWERIIELVKINIWD